MFNFLNLHPTHFGLDISDLSLKVVKLKPRQGKYDLISFNQKKLAPGIIQAGEIQKKEKIVLAIKDLVHKTPNLNTKYVVASLPEEKSFLRIIKLPKMSKEEAQKAVRFEAENYIPFSRDKVYLSSQVISFSEQKGTEVLIVALLKKIVDPYVEVLKRSGLVPLALETESQAAARALIKNWHTKAPLFIIDFGATCTNFSVYAGSSLRFTSFIALSSSKITESISQKLKIKIGEAEALKKVYGFKNVGQTGKKVYLATLPILKELVKEIKKHIDYYQSHAEAQNFSTEMKNIKKILLYGGGSELSGLSKFLEGQLGISVKKANPLVNLWTKFEKTKLLSYRKPLTYSVSIGLAMSQPGIKNTQQ